MTHRRPPFSLARWPRFAAGGLLLLTAACTPPGGGGPALFPTFGLERQPTRAAAAPIPQPSRSPLVSDLPGVVLDVVDGGYTDPTGPERAEAGALGALAPPARSWRAVDVLQLDVTLRPAGGGELLETQTLDQAETRADFVEAEHDVAYEVSVVARGNAGGTAADTALNARLPASTSFTPRAREADTRLAVPLDPTPFAVTLRLPSNLDTPGRMPAWVTGLDVVLRDPTRTPSTLVSTRYTPDTALALRDLRGGTHYAVTFTVHSLAGTTTTTVPDCFVPREDGALPDQVLDVPAFVPPTGTLLSTHELVGGAFAVAVGTDGHLWVTNQTGGTVTELDASGEAIGTPIAVGPNPRGVTVDRLTGDVWVANLNGGSVSRIQNHAVTATYPAGFFTGGVAVDPSSHVWVTSALSGSVNRLAPDGTAQPGSPFTVGAQPLNLAVNPTTGDVWVANSGSGSVSRITAAGEVSGPFATGAKPAGIAIAPDGTVWVVNSDAGTLSHLNADGTEAGPAINVGVGASGLAIDGSGNAMWIGLANGSRVAKRDLAGSLIGNYAAGTFPSNLAVDGNHHVWITGAGKLTELAP